MEQVQVWDRDFRGGPGPRFSVWPIDHPVEVPPKSAVITKQHTRVAISWSAAGPPTTDVITKDNVE
ncbi:hypothetical protein ACIBG4_06230 [Nonomuraea sp. NPDC050383]|uniref:hypothetical protein n=1 Tax=Nonomuraea sp. NPDC050383 TaxID=3364362 RepID=UPI0037928A8C